MMKLAVLSTFLLMAFASPDKKITVWLVGDSTMSVKETKAYPETGWGMPFAYFFDSTVIVENRAKNGRSTKTFISENLWQPVAENIKPGDYVFIQFGHNDESKEKGERYTTPEQYRANLTRFVLETRAKKGIPVLITPVSRRRFRDGKAVETHGIYPAIVHDLAKQLGTTFIDLDKKSRELYQELGDEQSKFLFLQLQPGEHPNYPGGKKDNTHFSELGARKIAQIVLSEIKALDLELSRRIVKPREK